MITRPLTWDVERAHEMWDANAPIADIAAFAGVSIASVMFQSHKRHWKHRKIGQERIYPCVACGTPDTAVRRGTRCPACSLLAKQERNRSRLRPMLDATPEPETAAETNDLDIQCYRAHKQIRRDEFVTQMQDARAALERELAQTKPKPGRPKKHGFMPQTFGRFAA